MVISRLRRGLFIALFAFAGIARAQDLPSGFIAAPGCKDIAYDESTQVLYISGGPEVRRYDMGTQTFLAPIALGGTTLGMDVSRDGRQLAIANGSRAASANFVDILNFRTGRTRRVDFPLEFGEGGTYSVAFDADGKLLVTSKYEGSGWTPLRRFDPKTGVVDQLASLAVPAMLSPSSGHRFVAIAEGNISSGPFGRYKTGDASYHATGALGWFLFEIGISPNGDQLAVPTYGGTFIDDRRKTFPSVGTYAGQTPIAAAYAPSGDVVYFPFAMSNYVAEYDRSTMTERRRFTVPGQFDWTGNGAYVEGRAKVSADGRMLFVTLNGGVFYQTLSAN